MTMKTKLTKGVDLELDYCTEDKSLEDFIQDVEGDGGEVQILELNGPGGGWPAILLKARTKAELKKLVNKHYDPSGEAWTEFSDDVQSF